MKNQNKEELMTKKMAVLKKKIGVRVIDKIMLLFLTSLLFSFSVLAASGEEFDWQQCAGESIRVISISDPFSVARKAMIADFEKNTGIKVQYDMYPYRSMYDKQIVELMTGKVTFDALTLQSFVYGRQYSLAGYLEPLEEYIADPNLTSPEFSLGKYFPGAINQSTIYDKLVGLTILMETGLLFYRKDLFDEYGATVPDTFDDLIVLAEKFTSDTTGDGEIDFYGFSARGSWANPSYLPWLRGYGGDFFDKEGNVVIDSPESVEGTMKYIEALRYAPPGIEGLAGFEAAGLFAAGKVAQVMINSPLAGLLTNPDKSKVVGLWEAGMVPRGPVGRRPILSTWMDSIYSGSPRKKAAWLLIQYMHSEKVQRELMLNHGIPVALEVIWEEPEVRQKLPSLSWLNACESNFALNPVPHVPPMIRGMEGRAAVEQRLATLIGKRNTVTREEIQKALGEAAEEIKSLLLPEEKPVW